MKVITTVVGELGTNCYLLIDEATREAALIDPADSPDELSALIEREGVTLRYILLTHGHRDHTLAAPAMHKRYPAPRSISTALTRTAPASTTIRSRASSTA